MSNIIVVCFIAYSSYSPFDWTVYEVHQITSSEAACGELAQDYHHASSYARAYFLPEQQKELIARCGEDYKDYWGPKP